MAGPGTTGQTEPADPSLPSDWGLGVALFASTAAHTASSYRRQKAQDLHTVREASLPTPGAMCSRGRAGSAGPTTPRQLLWIEQSVDLIIKLSSGDAVVRSQSCPFLLSGPAPSTVPVLLPHLNCCSCSLSQPPSPKSLPHPWELGFWRVFI